MTPQCGVHTLPMAPCHLFHIGFSQRPPLPSYFMGFPRLPRLSSLAHTQHPPGSLLHVPKSPAFPSTTRPTTHARPFTSPTSLTFSPTQHPRPPFQTSPSPPTSPTLPFPFTSPTFPPRPLTQPTTPTLPFHLPSSSPLPQSHTLSHLGDGSVSACLAIVRNILERPIAKP